MENVFEESVSGAENDKMSLSASTSELLLSISRGHGEEYSLWDKSVAIRRATGDGVVLEEDHWYVIESLREFYGEYYVSPFLTMFCHYLLMRDGRERWNVRHLKALFPVDGITRACRYAGLPAPIRRCCT